MRRSFLFIACVLALCQTPAFAQTIQTPGNAVNGSAVGFGPKGGTWTGVTPDTPLPTGSKQEVFQLASANVAASAVTVYGGDYVLTQSCTGYGSVALRYRGPDGATMLTLITKAATDSSGGTSVRFKSKDVVDVALTGTTACNVHLGRVPQ